MIAGTYQALCRAVRCAGVAVCLLAATGGAQAAGDDDLETYRMLRVFGEILQRLNDDYVEEIDSGALIVAAIRGMLDSLDRHTTYLDSKSYDALNTSTSGRFGGLGIRFERSQDGYINVISLIDDAPAGRAGMLPADVIIRVNGIDIKDMTTEEAVELLRGEVGSVVRLRVRREGNEEPLEFSVRRDTVTLNPVSVAREGNIVHLRVATFSRDTADRLAEAIAGLEKEDAPDGYILDLRGNPGGLLDEALKVADLFLDQGEILSVRNQRPDDGSREAARFQARDGDILSDRPLVVIIDGASASAAEIVAGALQDLQRAVVVGSQSYGKGSVQDIVDVGRLLGYQPGQHGLKLTTRHYFTPRGTSIDTLGITPDVTVTPESSMPESASFRSHHTPGDVVLAHAIARLNRLFLP